MYDIMEYIVIISYCQRITPMKKTLSLFVATVMAIGLLNADKAFATYNVVPKAPKISESLKPIILKYRNENYIGAMVD